MRFVVGLLLLGACTNTVGCAQGHFGKLGQASVMSDGMASDATNEEVALASDLPSEQRELASDTVLAESQASADDYEETDELPLAPADDEAFADDDQQPEVVLPGRAAAPSFKPGEGEVDIDRFTRRVTEVPLDIRSTEGAMPDDASASAFPDTTILSEPGPAPERVEVPVAYTPWTICYRPLYFEEIALERYGYSRGILQPAISGAHFFGSVAALPYKMTVRPPRSCECSNGFGLPGDCPLPGYGEHVLRADAALIHAAIVAGIVLALP